MTIDHSSRLVSNGLIFPSEIPVDIQLVTFLMLSNIIELSIREYLKTGIKSVIFCSASTCSILFEVTFLFKFFSLPSEYVFFTTAATSFLFAKFVYANLAAKFSNAKLLNSCVVMYLLL